MDAFGFAWFGAFALLGVVAVLRALRLRARHGIDRALAHLIGTVVLSGGIFAAAVWMWSEIGYGLAHGSVVLALCAVVLPVVLAWAAEWGWYRALTSRAASLATARNTAGMAATVIAAVVMLVAIQHFVAGVAR